MAKRMVENSEQVQNGHFNYQRKLNDMMHMMLILDTMGTLELPTIVREQFDIAKRFRQNWLDMPLYVEVDE